MDSSEIEMVELVCLSVGSFPVSTSGQTVFLERLVPTVAKTVFIYQVCLSRTARVLYSRLIGPIWGLLFGFVASKSTFKYAAVDFAESVFSRKSLLSHTSWAVISFRTFLYLAHAGCYVLGAHGGRKELVPITHLSSYFVSYPWVALATDFYLFKSYVFITYFIEHQVPRPLHIVFIFE